MEKILIIGGTGNIGFPIMQYLIKHNVQVVVGVRSLQKSEEIFKNYPNVELVLFDFLDEAIFEHALSGVHKVFFVCPPQLSKSK